MNPEETEARGEGKGLLLGQVTLGQSLEPKMSWPGGRGGDLAPGTA